MPKFNKFAFSLIIIICLVFHFDLICVKGEVVVESSGKHTTYVMIQNSCKGKKHGMTKVGVHVIGLGKLKSESVHIGLIEDFNRIEKLREIDESLKAMSLKYRYVGITTNGGTHKKPALTRLRDDVALEFLSPESARDSFSPLNFFKKYDLGVFLSVEHGCYKPYIMVYDSKSGKKIVEKTGKIDGTVKHVVKV